jgi:hypothetical protein
MYPDLFLDFELDFQIVIKNYIPARITTPCQDHDSPLYCDPGDDEELELEIYWVNSVKEHNLEKVLIDNIFPKDFVALLYKKGTKAALEYCKYYDKRYR